MELNEKGYPIWKDSKKLVHRFYAERDVIKRKLKHNEVVHHVDGDKKNFNPNNLAVMFRDSHDKIERDMWELTNLIFVHSIIIAFSFFFLIIFILTKGMYFIFVTIFLLFIAVVIPAFPRTLRKFLWKSGLYRKNKKVLINRS